VKVKGSEVGEWGFKKPNDGWHVVMMGEGIDFLKKEGAVVKDDKGNDLYKFPAKISDETAEDHNADCSLIISATPFGEKKIADILVAIDEFDNFEKAFPGDRSFFETEIMSKIKIKVANRLLKMKTETSKDGKYSNVISTANIKYVPKDAPVKGPAASKQAAAGQATAPAADTTGW
jgi:hypothetical protein